MQVYVPTMFEFTDHYSTSKDYRVGIFSSLSEAKKAVDTIVSGITWDAEPDEDGIYDPQSDVQSQIMVNGALHDIDWISIQIVELNLISPQFTPLIVIQ